MITSPFFDLNFDVVTILNSLMMTLLILCDFENVASADFNFFLQNILKFNVI